MLDLLYVAVVVVFFALMLLLVRACDHIIGPDEEALGHAPRTEPDDEEAEVGAEDRVAV